MYAGFAVLPWRQLYSTSHRTVPDLRSYTPQPVYTPDKRREHNVARLTLCTRTRLLLDSLRYSDQLRLFSMIHNELRTDVIRTEETN